MSSKDNELPPLVWGNDHPDNSIVAYTNMPDVGRSVICRSQLGKPAFNCILLNKRPNFEPFVIARSRTLDDCKDKAEYWFDIIWHSIQENKSKSASDNLKSAITVVLQNAVILGEQASAALNAPKSQDD